MARAKKPRNQDLDSLSEGKEDVRSTREKGNLRRANDAQGVAALKGRISTLVKEQTLKNKLQAQQIASEVINRDAKGGKDLQHYSRDYMLNHKFTVKDKLRDKPLSVEELGGQPNAILRKVSETEEYR